MNVLWLTPIAWWGIAALALPILIHLLTRQRTRIVPFPTLRFLRATRLAALRRRSVQDWWLLAMRLLILAAAVAALGGPVIVSATRQEEWRWRFVRAFVLAPGARADVEALVATERAANFSSEVFRPTAHIADGIRDGVMWLDRQPPASREVVIAGDIRNGALSDADLTMVPATTGIRFLPLPGTPEFPQFDVRSTQNDDGVIRHWRMRTTLFADRTRVEYSLDGAAKPPLNVEAAKQDRLFADAVREDYRSLEPNPINWEEAARWSRPPRGAAGIPADEGDRRWLWGAALLLLALETWARRKRRAPASSAEETRVA